MSGYRAIWQGALHGADCTPQQVEALLAQLPHTTLYNTLPWCQGAAAALPAHCSLQVLRLHDEQGLAAWLPLTAGRERLHGMRVCSLRLLGHPFNDRVALPMRAGDPALAQAVINALLTCPLHWDVLILSELHHGAERALLTSALALAANPALLGCEWRACASSPVLRLVPDGRAVDGGKSVANRVARARRKLAASGQVRFERLLPQPAQVPALLAQCKAVEDRSWKGEQALGIFSTAASRHFFHEVGARLAARGWLDIGLLYLNEQLVSYRVGFRYRQTYLDFNLAFDPALAPCAPGRILLDDMIRSSQQQGLRLVDASRSSRTEPHLLADWSQERIEHHELWLFRRSAKGRLMHLARRWLRPLLQPLLQRLRSRIGD